jgi:alkanesulfonate monooxygenase SsuD/methylene tetrahydromethanopterin reductase-like flavin-dependent oxidoreductase (luciferase family)
MGIAAVPVATEVFAPAARAQAAALGRPEFDAVYVPHPIQDQTNAEIEDRADAVIVELVSRLTGDAAPT